MKFYLVIIFHGCNQNIVPMRARSAEEAFNQALIVTKLENAKELVGVAKEIHEVPEEHQDKFITDPSDAIGLQLN